MHGGAGDDTYHVDDSGDIVNESTLVCSTSGGIDTVVASISYTLGDDVENLTLTGSAAINGTGNSLTNVIKGNSGANALAGERRQRHLLRRRRRQRDGACRIPAASTGSSPMSASR